jgi:outer membrane lipoprotein-sorting protein
MEGFLMHLLAALALLLQDKTAEETFKKIEETVQNAKTVRIKFKLEGALKDGQGKEKRIDKSGTLVFGDRNKLHITISDGINPVQIFSMISDGKTTRTVMTGAIITQETPSDLNRNFLRSLVRGGNVANLISTVGVQWDDETVLGTIYRVSDFEMSKDDRGAKALKYKMNGKGATLRYDPKTLLVLSRKLAEEDGGEVLETYEEFTLNGDIPEEKFKLPADK